MRVLFVSPPGLSHFFPLVPLAWAFRAAGHDLLYAFAEHTEDAAHAGLHVIDVAPGYSKVAVAEENSGQWARMTTEPLEDINEFAPLLAEANRPMVEALIQLAVRWQPDLVVHEQITTAGLLAAAKVGVPAIQHNVGFAPTEGLHASILKYLADLVEKYEITGSPEPAAILEVTPPGMRVNESKGWAMRFVPYNGGQVLPPWLGEPRTRPRIAITMGTLAEEYTGLRVAEAVLRAAPEIAADFVLTLGGVDPARFGELPPNVRVLDWIPLTALLEYCDGVVHHGGGSTTLTALESGVPQLVVPTLLDQPINGKAVQDRGAGLSVSADEVDAALLRRLIADEGFRRAAAEVRAEMKSLPSPADLVVRLTDLVSARRCA